MWLGWGLKRIPPEQYQIPSRGSDVAPTLAGWVHTWVDMLGSGEGLRLWEETVV